MVKKAGELKSQGFDHRSPRTAILLFLARIPVRIGFRDANLSFLYTEQRQKKEEGHSVIRNLSLLFDDLTSP